MTDGKDKCHIAIAEVHMYQSVVVGHSCYSSFLLHPGQLALL